MSTPPSPQNQSEWRSGRPSFKAFRPEVFFLTLFTIVSIVVGVKLSCSVLKNKTDDKDKPTPVSFDSVFSTSAAYAFDGPISDAQEDENVQAPATEADENALEPAPEEAVADAAPAEEPSAAESATTPAPAPAETTTDAHAAKTSHTAMKLWTIWIACLGIPALVWIWRGWKWIVAVYGIEYELRVDADNPRATTFLIKRGIFNKTTDSMTIGSIKDIKSEQSIWQKYLMGGVGTIILFTSDKTDESVKMKNMGEPSRVFNAFDTLRRHYWARGGMQLHTGADGAEDIGDDGGAEQLIGE